MTASDSYHRDHHHQHHWASVSAAITATTTTYQHGKLPDGVVRQTYAHRHTLAHCRRCLYWCTEATEATARTNVLKWRKRRRRKKERKKERKWRWKWRPKVQRVYKSSSRQSSRACSPSFLAAFFGYCTVVYFWLFIIVAVFHWLVLLSAAKHSVKLYFKTPTYLIVSVFSLHFHQIVLNFHVLIYFLNTAQTKVLFGLKNITSFLTASYITPLKFNFTLITSINGPINCSAAK